MADMLKISTPILPKNYVNSVRSNQQMPQDAFNLVDLSRVTKPNESGETTNNNTLNLANQREIVRTLSGLLTDPGLALASLKRLVLLSLISLNTGADPLTSTSFDGLVNSMMLSEGELLTEILSQQQGISAFQGEFFDSLRSLLAGSANPQLRESVGQLLKAISGTVYARDILDSISANLEKFSALMKGLPEVSEVFEKLAANFKNISPDDPAFPQLKDSLLSVLRELSDSIYANQKTMDLTTLIVYNLSKFVNEKEAISSAFDKFTRFIPEKMRETLIEQLNDYLATATKQSDSAPLHSKVIDSLSELIRQHTQNTAGSLSGSAEVYALLQSLSSAPTVFTPLLHYILPFRNEDGSALAELWVDPDSSGAGQTGERTTTVFFVADVEGLGQFEIELKVNEFRIDFRMFCPKEYTQYYQDFGTLIAESCQNMPYRFQSVSILPLEKARRLDEVFPRLAEKRIGIDVRA